MIFPGSLPWLTKVIYLNTNHPRWKRYLAWTSFTRGHRERGFWCGFSESENMDLAHRKRSYVGFPRSSGCFPLLWALSVQQAWAVMLMKSESKPSFHRIQLKQRCHCWQDKVKLRMQAFDPWDDGRMSKDLSRVLGMSSLGVGCVWWQQHRVCCDQLRSEELTQKCWDISSSRRGYNLGGKWLKIYRTHLGFPWAFYLHLFPKDASVAFFSQSSP